jgi:hypothetical protein
VNAKPYSGTLMGITDDPMAAAAVVAGLMAVSPLMALASVAVTVPAAASGIAGIPSDLPAGACGV